MYFDIHRLFNLSQPATLRCTCNLDYVDIYQNVVNQKLSYVWTPF